MCTCRTVYFNTKELKFMKYEVVDEEDHVNNIGYLYSMYYFHSNKLKPFYPTLIESDDKQF